MLTAVQPSARKEFLQIVRSGEGVKACGFVRRCRNMQQSHAGKAFCPTYYASHTLFGGPVDCTVDMADPGAWKG